MKKSIIAGVIALGLAGTYAVSVQGQTEYEKVSDTTMKVTETVVQEQTVDINILVARRGALVQQKSRIDTQIAEIDALINEARKVGIVAN